MALHMRSKLYLKLTRSHIPFPMCIWMLRDIHTQFSLALSALHCSLKEHLDTTTIYGLPDTHFIFHALAPSIYGRNSMHLTMAFSPERLDMFTYKSLIDVFSSLGNFLAFLRSSFILLFRNELTSSSVSNDNQRFVFLSLLLTFSFECSVRLSFSTTNGSKNSI